MSVIDGQRINKKVIDDTFLTGPGEDIVQKLLMQLASVPAFTKIFGPYKSEADGLKNTDNQRWADYQRFDWSIRQLPAMNVFEAQTETKEADNGYFNGNISIQVYWPPNFRRSDLSRVPAAFKAALQNFFASKYVADMLDEHVSVKRVMKVPGLNQLGRNINWSPNVEGFMAQELVPVTILEVAYKIDLRSWYRELESQGRTQDNPFEKSLEDLVGIDFGIEGVDNENADPVHIEVDSSVQVNQS